MAGLAACAARPVVYPDGKRTKEEFEDARKECEAKAKDFLKDLEARRAAGEVVESSAAGAAVGAVTGAVFGSVGRGAAAGGLSGAAIGMIRWLFRPSQPRPARRAYVDRCLRERGFDVIAWE